MQAIFDKTIFGSLSSGGGGFGTEDWANYDGTQDGAEFNLFTGAQWGPASVAWLSNGQTFFQAARKRDAPPERRYSVMTYNGKNSAPTERSFLTYNINKAVFPFICRLTDTRFLAGFTGNNDMEMRLFNLSDLDAPTLLDEVGPSDFGSSDFGNSCMIERLSDTTAVIFYEDDTNAGYYSAIVDITGDTITVGTPVDSNENGNVYGVCAVISPTLFASAIEDSLLLYSVSGTTITLEDTASIATSNDDMVGLVACSSTKLLLCYEDDATTDSVNAQVYTVSGGNALTAGTAVEISTGSRVFGGGAQNGGFRANDNTAVFVYTLQDVDTQDATVAVVSFNESNVCSVDATVTKSDVGDHPEVTLIPETSGTQALLVCQDRITDSPLVDAVSYTTIEASA